MKTALRSMLVAAFAAAALAACSQDEPPETTTSTQDQSSYNDYVPPVGEDDDTLVVEDAPVAEETTTTAEAAPRRRPRPAQTAAATPPPEGGPVDLHPEMPTTPDEEAITVVGRRAPVWERRPNRRQLEASYPRNALERGTPGEALLGCRVEANRDLQCTVLEESPRNRGFGAGALRVSRFLRVADGDTAVGQDLRIRVLFRISEEERRRRGLRPS